MGQVKIMMSAISVSVFPLAWFIAVAIHGVPIPNSNINVGRASESTVQLINFLRRFGYLPSTSSSANVNGTVVITESEAIFDHASVVRAIKQMQAYGGLLATGQMDNDTIALLTRPRCGVPDMGDGENRGRAGGSLQQTESGYASGLWQKRQISYSFENWLPNMDRETLETEMQKAFNIWSPYSRLTFRRKRSSQNSQPGDIAILFARGHHGDMYAFDGPGNILAHAFLPHGNGKSPTDGDIHFDADEEFVMEPVSTERGRGLYFLAVAAHEIGHSLGLSHSSDTNSIMFPYYQQSSTPALGSTDIMNLYTRYVKRILPDDEFVDQEGEDAEFDAEKGTSGTTITKSGTTTTPTPTMAPTTSMTSGTKGHDQEPNDAESTNPSICDVNFDSIAFLRNELFVFKDKMMWRLRDRGQPSSEYPALISRLFPALEGVPRIDAAFERESDGRLLFFSGRKFWAFDGTTLVDGSPRQIQEFGLPATVARVDAAFIWEKNHMTYFFSGPKFWRFNETANRIDDNYPQPITRWGGIPEKIDLKAVMRWRDGKTYFFGGDSFWKFDDSAVNVEDGFPLNTKQYWFHC